MGQFETANVLAILAGARRPQWVDQATYTGAPPLTSSGTYLEDAIATDVEVVMREAAHRRTARVTVTGVDLTNTYTVTIAGVACAAVGAHASLAALLAAIVTAVNTSASATVLAVLEDADDDGTDDTVKITGVAEADYTIAVSTSGAGTLACVADPMTGAMRLWMRGKGTNAPTAWVQPYQAQYTLTRRGFVERFATSGMEMLYIELYDLAGSGDGGSVTYAPTVTTGPCVAE